MTKAAWFCPSCQKHHAPHCDTCPAPVDAISPFRMPSYPAPTLPRGPVWTAPNTNPIPPVMTICDLPSGTHGHTLCAH